MRAIGYVARRDADAADTDAYDSDSTLDWDFTLDSVAGSWDHFGEVANWSNEQSLDPVQQVVEHCRAAGHQLVTVLTRRPEDDVELSSEPALEDVSIDEMDRRSAYEFGDHQFTELMSLIEGAYGKPALIVIPDSTHLASDLETLIERLLLIRRSGSDVICSDRDIPDPLQNGEEMLGLRGEPDWLRKRVRAKIREKASRGKVLGRTPYGYRCGADGTLKPVAEEAEVVKKIFKWYVGADEEQSPEESGRVQQKGMGMRLIAQRLTNENYPTRTGRPWSTATVSLILKNRVYVGTYTRYGFLVAGNHEPIIGRALFRRAQDELMLKQRKRQKSRTEEPFLLGGLLTCGKCGHGVPGLTRRRSWRRRDGSTASKTYRYYEFYECQQRRTSKNGNDEEAICPTWRANDLDGEVRTAIVQWQSDTIDQIRPVEMKLSLEEQLEMAEKAFLQETREISTGHGDIELLAPFLDEVKRIRQEIEADKECEAAAGSNVRGKVARTRLVKDLIADAIGSQDVQTAHTAIASLVEDVIVTKDDVYVLPRIPM